MDGFDVIIKHSRLRDKVDKMSDKELQSALKLQELVKERIKKLSIPNPSGENHRHIPLYELQSLVEESERWYMII